VLYVLLHPESIDLWALAVHYWPEVFGGFSGLAAIIGAVLIGRVARRPRQRGEPYCRRCNYHLVHLARPDPALPKKFIVDEGARCPECGVELGKRPPLRARRAVVRILPIAAPVGAVVIAYGLLMALGVARDGRASEWLYFSSGIVNRWDAAHKPAWMKPWRRAVSRVVAVDPGTGTVVRTVCERREETWINLGLTPDGGSFFLQGARSTLLRISARSGRTLGSLTVPRINGTGQDESAAVVGFSRDGNTVFLACLDEPGQRSQLWAWDLATGGHRIVIDEPAYVVQNRAQIRRYLMGETSPDRFLSITSFMESNETQKYTVEVFGADGSLQRSFDLPVFSQNHPGGLMATSGPAVTPECGTMFGWFDVGCLLEADIESGSRTGLLKCPDERGGFLFSPIVSKDGRLLGGGAYVGSIFIRDIRAHAWLARLTHDGSLIAPQLFISPDNRWFAATPFQNTPVRRPIHELLLFDLSQLPSAPATPGAPGGR
jgi:hypothetical protein